MLCKVVLVLAMLGVTGAIYCPPDICLRAMCVPVDRECLNGKLVPGGGYCGCCAACIPNLTVIVICLQVGNVQSLVCPPDICWRMFCAAPSECPNGTIKPHAGYCGCCPACVPNLKIGDSCGLTFLIGSVKGQCPKGSVCDTKSLTCTAVDNARK